MHFYTLPTLLSLALATLATPHQQRAADPIVVISQGTVIGTATRVQNQPSVTGLANAYLGVPYAQKPVRFGPPQNATKFTAPFVAKKLPPVCLQSNGVSPTGQQIKFYFNNPIRNPDPAEAEDCLYLNVYTPQNATSSSKKAVLFWIFGGNLASGGASLAAYNGSSLAVNQDVVVVVPNYRTNIFGFSGSPEIDIDLRNSGFLDQRLALQWVQDNIAKFGGDPGKVTIFGESAGGFSVKQLLAAPPSPLPFRAAILESQGQILGNSSASYQAVVDHFNCTRAASPLACLRSPSISGVDIQNYIQSQTNVTFPPVANRYNLNANTKPSIDSGAFAPVPVLIGTNNDEVTVFLEIAGSTPSNPLPISLVVDTLFPGLNVSNITDVLAPVYAPLIGNATYQIENRILTDLIFTCTTSKLSEYVAGKKRQPVWRYRYDPGFPNVDYDKDYLKAYHTAEIFSVFGTYPLNNQYGAATSTQIALSANMQKIWADFAKNPTAGPGWPQLQSTSDGNELGVFGGVNKTTGEQTVNKLVADYPCPLLELFFTPGTGY